LERGKTGMLLSGKNENERKNLKGGNPLENPFAVCFGGRNAICREDNSFLILLGRTKAK